MSDILSQDEINALLGGNISTPTDEVILTDMQKDTIGEIGNISMGTAATTLSSLLSQRVLITTPNVKIMNWRDISKAYDRPCVGVKIDYTIGIKGTNILILKNSDVKIITDLMMGGTGVVDGESELTEIDLSAIGEAMNQMIGSSSTSLASLINEKIDIATPKAFEINFEDDDFFKNIGFGEDRVLATIFRMQIGDLIDSEMMQILPIDFAIQMSNKLDQGQSINQSEPIMDSQEVQPVQSSTVYNNPADVSNLQGTNNYGASKSSSVNNSQGVVKTDDFDIQGSKTQQIQSNINAQPAQFHNFDVAAVKQQKENIDILMDVPLEVTVELGKTSKRIKEILEFSPGTIIELDKLAGEPIDILVNGKYVAKGEVVVIDENFAIRVTSIINPEFRI